MDILSNEGDDRPSHRIQGQHRRRLLEKQLRPEILHRSLQFIDVAIHQILFQENLYPSGHLTQSSFASETRRRKCSSDVFVTRQAYGSLAHRCTDDDLSAYIRLCVASLADLLADQFSDMISINIVSNTASPLPQILRRYLIELHLIDDRCLRSIHDNARQLLDQLDRTFSQCLTAIVDVRPLPTSHPSHSRQWTFQMR